MSPRFRISDWLVEPDLNHIVRADGVVQLEPKVMDVLAFLASHPGEVCSKETIIKAVWPGTFVSDDVLAYSISELRKAFGDNAREPSVIATIAKRGYRLIAPVTRLPEERSQEMQQTPRDLEKSQSAGTGTQPRKTAGRWTSGLRTKVAAVLLSMTLLLTLLIWYLLPGEHSEMTRIGITPIVTANLAAYDYYLKGREYYRRYRSRDNENAIAMFEKVLQLDPGLALAHAGLADCYAQKAYQFGFPAVWTERAFEESRKALSMDPEMAEAHKALGFAYWNRGQFHQALNAYYRAVELNPSYSAPITNIAATLEQQGKYFEALLWTKRALSLNPRESIVYFNIGDIYRDLHDTDRAEEWYGKALSLNPDYEPARIAMSRLHMVRKNYPEALKESQRIFSLNPTSVNALSAVGHAYLASGDLEKAGERYRSALAIVPNLDAAIHLGLVLWKQGRRAEAQGLFDQLTPPAQKDIDAGSESWRPWWVIAVVRAVQGDTKEALSCLEKAAAAGWRPGPGGWDDHHYKTLLGEERYRTLTATLNNDVNQQRRRAHLLAIPPESNR